MLSFNRWLVRQDLLKEENISSIFYRFLDLVRGQPGFGPGVNPRDWGEVKEIVDANGLVALDFESAWQRAVAEEDKDAQIAVKIYKKLADSNPISGLRSSSYYSRINEPNRLHVVGDIDNMKLLNDRLGHRGTDSVIKKFGELFRRYLEDATNDEFGPIAKSYHRSGDEFNAMINISATELEKLVPFVKQQCEKMLGEFGGIVFSSELGKSRATGTLGIGLDEKKTDHLMNQTKIQRRQLKIGSDMRHIVIHPDLDHFLAN